MALQLALVGFEHRDVTPDAHHQQAVGQHHTVGGHRHIDQRTVFAAVLVFKNDGLTGRNAPHRLHECLGVHLPLDACQPQLQVLLFRVAQQVGAGPVGLDEVQRVRVHDIDGICCLRDDGRHQGLAVEVGFLRRTFGCDVARHPQHAHE